jgi:hypothetical protein
MPRSYARPRRDQFFEPVECKPTPLSHVTSRQGSVLWECKSACRVSKPVGRPLGLRPIATGSERS